MTDVTLDTSSKDRSPPADFRFEINRTLALPLTDQICAAIRAAIEQGALAPRARLPSWQDLSAQLGVARGTVRAAYYRLTDEGMIASSGAAGTHVADSPTQASPATTDRFADLRSTLDLFGAGPPGIFQMGVPAHDAFPAKLWARLHRRAADAGALRTRYLDPRGMDALRHQIAAHLALARGLQCTPGQVFIATSFRGALGLVLQALPSARRRAWVEDPGYPVSRHGLELAGFSPVPIAVDGQGLDVNLGIALARDAGLAVLTPGQQAPLGHTLSPERRQALLAWARESEAWIIEDDYLSELHLDGRAAPALAASDPDGRVIHIGTFSKTISPSLGIGFLVAPETLIARLMRVATYLAPPPNYAAQAALAEFLADGHYLRHLRRMKLLYRKRREAVLDALQAAGSVRAAGLAVHVPLASEVDDVGLVGRLREEGFAPTALSQWFGSQAPEKGLVIGITNAAPETLPGDAARLLSLIRDDVRPAPRSRGA